MKLEGAFQKPVQSILCPIVIFTYSNGLDKTLCLSKFQTLHGRIDINILYIYSGLCCFKKFLHIVSHWILGMMGADDKINFSSV